MATLLDKTRKARHAGARRSLAEYGLAQFVGIGLLAASLLWGCATSQGIKDTQTKPCAATQGENKPKPEDAFLDTEGCPTKSSTSRPSTRSK